MITVICLNAKNDLEVIVASRLGYERENKRFFFEMMGSPTVYYYDGVAADMASGAIKSAIKQGGVSLKEFGPYKVRRTESVDVPVVGPAPVVAPRNCPKAVSDETKVMPPIKSQRAVARGEEAKPVERKTAGEKASFMDKVSRVLDDGVKKAKNFVQEVAVAAEEEEQKDKERADARKAEWSKKKSELEAAAEERRAKRAAARAALRDDDDEDDDDENASEFNAIAEGVAAAVEESMEQNAPVVAGNADSLATSTEDEKAVAAHVANVMAEKSDDKKNTDDDLKEITQLNLDFGDIDDMMDDIMG